MSLNRSKAVIELGKRLVNQLNAGDDLIASWMAHHLAALIHEAETAAPERLRTARDECATAILELWHYRNEFPEHLRPLRELEPVVRALGYLALDPADYRYYPDAMRAAVSANADENTKRWLELAIGLDFSTRLLVRFALQSAAQGAASCAEPWVALAQEAGVEETAELRVAMHFLPDDLKKGREDPAMTKLKDRLTRLEQFVTVATAVADDLRSQLISAERKET